ncbi:tail fiber protein [Vibrio phage PVP-XSN]|uniref:Tail fiber protein n=1 Tax=Vibrio phage PVP-XSN TaxID=3056214 RepID=A0AAX3Y3M1_9CAUD|nr:tail fiber protein [Vibrio phage PVP-XSN]
MGSTLTTIGRSKLASATPENQLNVTEIAVGDGNGGYPPISPSTTSLSNEVWRGNVSLPIRTDDDLVIIFEGSIPANIGGFVVREVGIFDDAGDLIAIGTTSEIEKPDLSSGSSVALTVRLHVLLDNASQVTLMFNDTTTIDHAGLGNRSAADSHPASAISTGALPDIGANAESDAQAVLALLKSGAIKRHQSSLSDSTTDRLLLTGAFGLGGEAIVSSDWNAITKSGFYTNSNQSQPELPSTQAYMMMVHINNGNYSSQICMRSNSDDPQTWRRSKQAGVWGGWVELQDDGYREITDANQALKSGLYSLPFSSGNNAPIENSGTLIVVQGGQNQNYISQTFIQSNETDEERIFVRHKKLSSWTSWVELHHSGNNDEVGFVKYAITTVTPTGRYIKANGAAVSRTAYAELFAKIGTFWGVGDGSTTFNVPDLRGEFIRTWDDGRGVDSGRSFGTWQADELKSHTHNVQTYSTDTSNNGNYVDSGDENVPSGFENNAALATGGVETRPRNIALIAWIRY